MKFYLQILILTCAGLLAGCSPRAEFRTVEGVMLGTTLHLMAQSEAPADELYAQAMAIDREMKHSMSIFDSTSLLSRLNRNECDSVDHHIAYNLALAQEISALSGGAYDVTVGPLVAAWGFAGKAGIATPNIDSLLQFVGNDKVSILRSEEGLKLRKEDSRVQLDFNSIAKGYTVDLLARDLEQRGVENYLVDIGGEVRCRGINRRGTPWRIGIERPIDGAPLGASYEMRIALSEGALATSGNYRRYFINPEGQRVAHTIDPRTGRSQLSRLLSATVVADECARADAMATMFMALGADGALSLLEEHPEWSVLLILAPEEGQQGLICRTTPAMERLIME